MSQPKASLKSALQPPWKLDVSAVKSFLVGGRRPTSARPWPDLPGWSVGVNAPPGNKLEFVFCQRLTSMVPSRILSIQEPALRVHDAAHDCLVQLRLKVPSCVACCPAVRCPVIGYTMTPSAKVQGVSHGVSQEKAQGKLKSELRSISHGNSDGAFRAWDFLWDILWQRPWPSRWNLP
jgi:hypothetical protein